MSDLTSVQQAAKERWIECGSTCRDRGHTMQWPYCQRGADPITGLPPAERAAAEAIRAFQHIPDGGDGHPAIRMGSDWDLAKVALVAARPLIEAEVRNVVASELAVFTMTTSSPLTGWHIYDSDGEPGLFHVCPDSDPDLGVYVHSDDAMSLSRIVAEISSHRCENVAARLAEGDGRDSAEPPEPIDHRTYSEQMGDVAAAMVAGLDEAVRADWEDRLAEGGEFGE